MKCWDCMGTSWQPAIVDWASVVDGRLQVVRNVSVSECEQCGNQVVSSRTAHALDRVRAKGPTPEMLQVDVFDLGPKPVSTDGTVGAGWFQEGDRAVPTI